MRTLFIFGTILILRAKLSHQQAIILRPCVCAPAPEVCGNDWQTYPSACDMKCKNSNTEVLFEGQCGEYFTRFRLINHYYPIFHSPFPPPPIGLYPNSPNHFPSNNNQFQPIPPYNLIWKDRFVSNIPISSNHQFHPIYYPPVQPHTPLCNPTKEITDNDKESHKLVLAQNGPEIIIITGGTGGKEHDDINSVDSHSSNEHKQEPEGTHTVPDTKISTANNSTIVSSHTSTTINHSTAVTSSTNNDPVISTDESIKAKTIKSITANHVPTTDESVSKGSNSKHEPDPVISSTTNGTESGTSDEKISTSLNAIKVTVSTSLNTTDNLLKPNSTDPASKAIGDSNKITESGTANEIVSTSLNATKVTVSTSLNTTDNLLTPSSTDPASKVIEDSNKTNQTEHEEQEANTDLSGNHNLNSTNISGKTIKSTTANDQSDINILNTTNGTESSISSTPNELVSTTLNATKSVDNVFKPSSTNPASKAIGDSNKITESGTSNEIVSTSLNATKVIVSTSLNTTDDLLKPSSTDPASKVIENSNKTNQTEQEEREANSDLSENHNPSSTNISSETIKSTTANDHNSTIDQSDPNISNTTNGTESSISITHYELVSTTLNATKSTDNFLKPNLTDPASKTIEDGNTTNQTEHDEREVNADLPENHNINGINNSSIVSEGKLDGEHLLNLSTDYPINKYQDEHDQNKTNSTAFVSETSYTNNGPIDTTPNITDVTPIKSINPTDRSAELESSSSEGDESKETSSTKSLDTAALKGILLYLKRQQERPRTNLSSKRDKYEEFGLTPTDKNLGNDSSLEYLEPINNQLKLLQNNNDSDDKINITNKNTETSYFKPDSITTKKYLTEEQNDSKKILSLPLNSKEIGNISILFDNKKVLPLLSQKLNISSNNDELSTTKKTLIKKIPISANEAIKSINNQASDGKDAVLKNNDKHHKKYNYKVNEQQEKLLLEPLLIEKLQKKPLFIIESSIDDNKQHQKKLHNKREKVLGLQLISSAKTNGRDNIRNLTNDEEESENKMTKHTKNTQEFVKVVLKLFLTKEPRSDVGIIYDIDEKNHKNNRHKKNSLKDIKNLEEILTKMILRVNKSQKKHSKQDLEKILSALASSVYIKEKDNDENSTEYDKKRQMILNDEKYFENLLFGLLSSRGTHQKNSKSSSSSSIESKYKESKSENTIDSDSENASSSSYSGNENSRTEESSDLASNTITMETIPENDFSSSSSSKENSSTDESSYLNADTITIDTNLENASSSSSIDNENSITEESHDLDTDTIPTNSKYASSNSLSREETSKSKQSSDLNTDTITIDTNSENGSASNSSNEEYPNDTNSENASTNSFSSEENLKSKKSSDLHTDAITIDTNSENASSSSYSDEENSRTKESSGKDTDTITIDTNSENASTNSFSSEENLKSKKSSDLHTDTITIDTNSENASSSSYSDEENSRIKESSGKDTDTITIDTNSENASASSSGGEKNSRSEESNDLDTDTITVAKKSKNIFSSSSSGNENSRTEESSDLDTGSTTIDTNSENLSLSSLSAEHLTSKDIKDYKKIVTEHSKDDENSEILSQLITSENINNNDHKREEKIAEELWTLFWSENYNLKNNKKLHNKKQAKHEEKLTSSSSEKWKSTSKDIYRDDYVDKYKRLLKNYPKGEEDLKEELLKLITSENTVKTSNTKESHKNIHKKKHPKREKEIQEQLLKILWSENHSQKNKSREHQQPQKNIRAKHEKKIHSSNSKEWKSTTEDIDNDGDKYEKLIKKHFKDEEHLKEELLKIIASKNINKNSNKNKSNENIHKKNHSKHEKEIEEELLKFFWSENHHRKNYKNKSNEYQDLYKKKHAKHDKKLYSSSSEEWKSISKDSDNDEDEYRKLRQYHSKSEEDSKELLPKLIESENIVKNSKIESHESLYEKAHSKGQKDLEELSKLFWNEKHHQKNYEVIFQPTEPKDFHKKKHSSSSDEWKSTFKDSDDNVEEYKKLIKIEEEMAKLILSENRQKKDKNKYNGHQDLLKKRRAKHSRKLHNFSSREWELNSKDIEKKFEKHNNKHSKNEDNLKQVLSKLITNENILKKSSEKQNIHKKKDWRDEELKELLKLYSSGELHKKNTHENSLISITIEKTKPTSESSSIEKRSNYLQLSFRDTNQKPNNNNSSLEDGGPAEIFRNISNLENGGPAEALKHTLLQNSNKISEPNLTIPISEDINNYNLKNLTFRKYIFKEALESPLLSPPALSTKHSKVNFTENSYPSINDENTAEINLKGNNTAPSSIEAEVPIYVNNQTDSKINFTTAAIEYLIPSSIEVKTEPPKINVAEDILELARQSLLCPFCSDKKSISGEKSGIKYQELNDGNTAQANSKENNTDSSTTKAEVPLGYSMKNETDNKKDFIKETIEYPIPSSLPLYNKQPKINVTEGINSELSSFITEPSPTEAEIPIDYNLKNQSGSKINFNAYIPSSQALDEKIQKINLTESFIKYQGSNNDNTADTNLNDNDTKLSTIVAEVPLDYNSKNQMDNEVTFSKNTTEYSVPEGRDESLALKVDPPKLNLTEAEIIELAKTFLYPPLSTNTNSTIKESLVINNKGSNKENIAQTNANIKKAVKELEPSGKESTNQDTISDDAILSTVKDRLYKYNPKREHNRQKVYNKHSRSNKTLKDMLSQLLSIEDIKKQTNENFDDGDDSFSSEKENFEKRKQSKNLNMEHAESKQRRNKLKGLLSIIIQNPRTDTTSDEEWSELSKVISSAKAKKEQSSENFHDDKISQNKHHKIHSKYKKNLIDELSKVISGEDIESEGSREQHKDDDQKNEHDLIEELIEQSKKIKRKDKDIDHKYENYISHKKHHEKPYSKDEKDPMKELYKLISKEGLNEQDEYVNYKHYNMKSANKHLKDFKELSKVISREPSDRDSYYLQSTDDDKQQRSAEPDGNDEKNESQIKENKIKHSKNQKDLEDAMSILLSSKEINKQNRDGNPKNDNQKSEKTHAKKKHSENEKGLIEGQSKLISSSKTKGKHSDDNTKNSKKLQKKHHKKKSKDEQDLIKELSEIISKKETKGKNRDRVPKEDNDETRQKHHKKKHLKNEKALNEMLSKLISEKRNNGVEKHKKEHKNHRLLDAKSLKKVL